MITSPHEMDRQWQAAYNYLTQKLSSYIIPPELQNKINNLGDSWNTEYAHQSWGDEALVYKTDAKWSDTEQAKWNNNLDYFKKLIVSTLSDPRTVPVAPLAPSKMPKAKELPEIHITAKYAPPLVKPSIPILPAPLPTPEPFNYWWLVGGAAALGAIALLLGKKTTKPALAEFGLPPKQHMARFDLYLDRAHTMMNLASRLRDKSKLWEAKGWISKADAHLYSVTDKPNPEDSQKVINAETKLWFLQKENW